MIIFLKFLIDDYILMIITLYTHIHLFTNHKFRVVNFVNWVNVWSCGGEIFFW